MDINYTFSILIQVGIAAVVISIMYRLHRFVDGFEKDERELMERRRNERRQATRERVSALEQLSGEQLSLLSPALTGFEQILLRPSKGFEPGDISIPFSRPRSIGETCEAEIASVEKADFQCVPVCISLEEEILR